MSSHRQGRTFPQENIMSYYELIFSGCWLFCGRFVNCDFLDFQVECCGLISTTEQQFAVLNSAYILICQIGISVAWGVFFSFIFIRSRLITLQYCSGFCHTLTWISHGFICTPHPDPPSHLPLHPIPLGLPSAPGPSTCLMHPTWAGDLFHPR